MEFVESYWNEQQWALIQQVAAAAKHYDKLRAYGAPRFYQRQYEYYTSLFQGFAALAESMQLRVRVE